MDNYNDFAINQERINPFDSINSNDTTLTNYLISVEHLGRYMFATDVLYGHEYILDVACGTGYGTWLLGNTNGNVIGIDNDYECVKRAIKYYQSDNILFKRMDLNTNNITSTYDGITCFETIEHLKYPDRFLQNLYHVLSDDGLLLLSVPNSDYEKFDKHGHNVDPYHLHVFNYNELVYLLHKVGFKILNILGQAATNDIINSNTNWFKPTNLFQDALTIGYPNNINIHITYSYIFILGKNIL